MPKGSTNRILNVLFTLIFIAVLIFLLMEMQKPISKNEVYVTSYLFFESINTDQLVVLKSIIMSFTVVFPIFIGVSYFIRKKIDKTPTWFLLALLILLAIGIYLTFLI